MTYRLTNRAETDLVEIGRFFGEVNPAAGQRLFGRFEDKWELLVRHPGDGARTSGVR